MHVPSILIVLAVAVAAPLVGAAMVSVILFPLVAMRLTVPLVVRRSRRSHDRGGL